MRFLELKSRLSGNLFRLLRFTLIGFVIFYFVERDLGRALLMSLACLVGMTLALGLGWWKKR